MDLITKLLFERFRGFAQERLTELSHGSLVLESIPDLVDPWHYFDPSLRTDPELREAAHGYAREICELCLTWEE